MLRAVSRAAAHAEQISLIYCLSNRMDRSEFENIRDLPGKRITRTLQFSGKKSSRPLFVLESVPVENSAGIDLFLSGSFNPEIQRLTLNFSVRGTGPICRFCINGRLHPGAGRTHKHDLHAEDDPEQNLPMAVPRAELTAMTLPEAWQAICRQAKIEHQGELILPSQGAKGG